MEWNISKGIDVYELCKLRTFDGLCDWAKKTKLSDIGKRCCHQDCHDTFWYNLGRIEIRDELLALTKEK